MYTYTVSNIIRKTNIQHILHILHIQHQQARECIYIYICLEESKEGNYEYLQKITISSERCGFITIPLKMHINHKNGKTPPECHCPLISTVAFARARERVNVYVSV